MRLLVATMQMALNTGDQFRLVGGAALAQGVGLNVLVEQFVPVSFL
ncbi:MAG: hypothetical protein ABIP64_18820 [Burkholderiales bacterium]